MAPEHPPQLMLTLNLYVCSADMFALFAVLDRGVMDVLCGVPFCVL